MPSAFTHAIVGASAAQMLPASVPKPRTALLLAALAVAPDLDVLAFGFGIPYGHMFGHRGFSHSLVCAALLAAPVAFLVCRWADNKGRATLLRIWLIAFAVVASHGFLDAATDAGRGIGFLITFSDHRFFLPFRPIQTSSVNPTRFFSTRGLQILGCEALWVWLPLGLATMLLHWSRWRRGSSSSVSLGRSA